MASSDADPIPLKNAAHRVTFALKDVNDDLVSGATALDSERSIDGGTFADCSNEATEIATASGMYYLDLNASEMNGDTVALIVKASDAKTRDNVLYPVTGGIKEIYSDTTVIATDANNIYSDTSLIKVDTGNIFSDTSLAEPQLTTIASDLVKVYSDTTRIWSDLVIADAAIDSVKSDTAVIEAAWTTALTEAYAADGAAFTPAQALYQIWAAVAEFAIGGTTITAKKLDGNTTAMTFTLDDGADPTSRTRAT
jgi:hypothetical protein